MRGPVAPSHGLLTTETHHAWYRQRGGSLGLQEAEGSYHLLVAEVFLSWGSLVLGGDEGKEK